MKYTNYLGFEKHLNESFPDNHSKIYGLIVPKRDEELWFRSNLIERIRKSNQSGNALEKAEAIDVIITQDPIAELSTMSLFQESKIVVVEEAERYKGKDQKALLSLLASLPESTFVILSGKSIPFYAGLKQSMVVFDLSSEKPWDYKERVLRSVYMYAKSQGRTLSSSLLDALMKYHPTDFSFYLQEIDKLFTFCANKEKIELSDYLLLAAPDKKEEGWGVSEALIWDGKILDHEIDFNALVAQLRYHLMIGLQLSSGMELPQLRAKQLNKYQSKLKPFSFYRRALIDLFETELLGKTSYQKPSVMWSIFSIKLKEYYDSFSLAKSSR